MKTIFVGLGGIPYGKRAIDVRINSLAKLFIQIGGGSEVINRFSNYHIENNTEYEIHDPFKNHKNSTGILFIFWYALSLLIEPYHIFKSHRKEKVDIILTSSGHFIDIFVYYLICKIIGAKLIYEYCEYRSAVNRNSLYHKINSWFVDNFSPKLWDGAICITHFLQEACKNINPKLKTTIIYPLCDFREYENIEPAQLNQKYILFCGSVEYEKTLSLVCKSYLESAIKNRYKLLLVLRGNENKINEIKKDPNFIVKTNLEYNDLISLYKQAEALLIPIENTIRDTARFPNKICEYSASKGLIITTNNGEIPYIYKDKVNALVANDFSIDSFVCCLNFLIDDNLNKKQIKENGYKIGVDNFSLSANKEKISTLIQNLFNKVI